MDITFSLPGAIGTGALTLSVGGTYDTDHELTISLNDTPLETATWSALSFYEVTIDPVDLNPDENTLTLQCLSGEDSIAVDYLEVVYTRDFSATTDTLKFTPETGERYEITGFTGDELLAFDITTASEVTRVINGETTGTNPYTLTLEPYGGGIGNTYLVLSTDQVKSPSEITEDTASTLSDTTNEADYLVITHRDIGWDSGGTKRTWLTSLIALREAQGLTVMAVDSEDILDEFSYGIFTPQAVKDFISYAYSSWTPPAPTYVLLVGDSTYDPKDHWSWWVSDTTTTYLPCYLAHTAHMGETVTDEWLVRISGDDALPDLYIGRLPAKTHEEATSMITKLIAYETTANTKSWEKDTVLIADNQTEDYESVFETINEDAAALMPSGMHTPFTGFLGDYLATDELTADIKEAINDGALIVNYAGHGSTQIWAHETLFDTTDVTQLTNEALPFIISMSCLTGHFVYPESWNFPSLAEAFLRAEDTGAVAALMPSGMTTTDGQHILHTALFEALFTEDIRTLGEAISHAKETLLANSADYEEVSETFLLFGDPAMTLKIPLPRRPTGLSAESTSQGITLSWSASLDCNGNAVSGYYIYRATSPGGPYTKLTDSLITTTTSTDTTAEEGTTYYYVVTSVDSDGDESVTAAEVSITAGSTDASTSPDTEDGADTDETSGTDSAGDEQSTLTGHSSGPCFIGTAGEK